MQQSNHRNASVDNNFSSHDLDKSHDDDVSDISEEDDFLPGGGHPDDAHNVASMKKYRVFWNQQKEEFLLRCYNHYRLTSSSDHGLKGKSWRRIAVRMTAEFNEEYDSKSCRNKMNVLRYDYSNYKSLLEARAAGKDSEDFWNQLIAKTPRAAKWRDSPFPYYETLRRILEENGDGVDQLPYLEIQELPPNTQLPPPPPHQGHPSHPSSATKKRPRESLASNPGNTSPRKRGPGAGDLHELGNQTNHPFPSHPSHSSHPHLQPPQSHPSLPALPSGANDPNPDHQQQPQGITLEGATEILLTRMKEGFDSLAELIKNYRYLEQSLDKVKGAMAELNKDKYRDLMSNPASREKIFHALKDVNRANDFLLYPEEFRVDYLVELIRNA